MLLAVHDEYEDYDENDEYGEYEVVGAGLPLWGCPVRNRCLWYLTQARERGH